MINEIGNCDIEKLIEITEPNNPDELSKAEMLAVVNRLCIYIQHIEEEIR